ncbi:TonB-dependent receptor plug domain-containing protein [Hymenobacter algoricola]|uniref:Plug domain-containing protein n=1 Tax=Hymenobacter algoricola TaxID=486267 RepID=A0ABP7MAX9_9BACT
MKHSRLPAAWAAALALVLLLTAFRRPADDGFIQRLQAQLTRFYTATYPEKAYLHLDKGIYAAGETLWFKAYLVDAAQHQPDTLSRVLYVDLLTPENKVLTQRILALRRGTAPGDIDLDAGLAPGTYTVRAYTSWMRNAGAGYFFQRPITVLAAGRVSRLPAAAPLTGLDVQFFPEGGQLVAGLASTVALKATGAYGEGVEVSGEVQDDQGTPVVSFRSQRLGMGRFQFTPEAGRQYKAVLRQPASSRSSYALPAAQPTGFAMQVLDMDTYFQLAVQRRALAPAAEPITLVAQVRGQLAYAAQGVMKDANAFVVRVPKDKFPAGIAHFTLFDGQNRARCERLVFVHTAPDLRLTLQPDQASYGPRDKITVRIAATDAAGRPVAGQFSLAVNNAALVPADSGATDIRTYLLLDSDLRGRVETPGSYFANNLPATRQALDNLLLTQGWRRFVWPDLLAGRLGTRPYPLEQSLSLSGLVLGNKKVPAPGATVTLFRLGAEKDVAQATTDSTGRFLFSNFDGRDTARLMVQAAPAKGLRNPVIQLDRLIPEVVTLPVRPLTPDSEVQAAYLKGSRRQIAQQQQYQARGKSILLDNVTVKANRPLPPDPRRIYGRADAVVATKDIVASATYTNVLQLLQGRVPGVLITGTPNDMHARIRGINTINTSNEALYVLDGIPIDASRLTSIIVQDVATVEVLKSSSAAIFGARAGTGVISILTRQGAPEYGYSGGEADRGLLGYALPNFQPVREFYVPAYGDKSTPATDYRSATLYWNPDVRTDAAGQASVSFYASDETGPFQLMLEGLTDTGQAGRSTAGFRVAAAR